MNVGIASSRPDARIACRVCAESKTDVGSLALMANSADCRLFFEGAFALPDAAVSDSYQCPLRRPQYPPPPNSNTKTITIRINSIGSLLFIMTS
jgi:hypothetical protein